MPEPKGYSLIGAALAHLIDSMNKASAWKDHSAELVEIAAAFRRIAEPLGPEGVENALLAHVESEHKDGRATYANIGTTLMANIQFILRNADPPGRFRKSCRISKQFRVDSVASRPRRR